MMKKLLLGTTAIVGASFMASTAMAKPEVRIGGYYEFQVGMTSQDIDNFGPSPGGFGAVTNERGYGFLNDSEVIVRVSDKLDNGLAWSVKIEIETSEDQVDDGDETTLTLQGSWGRIWFGDDDGPVDTMKTGGKRAVGDAGAGGIGGDFRRWIGWNTANNGLWSNSEDVLDTSDAVKIAYFTPRVAGFQAGVSFTPDEEDLSHDRDTDGNGTMQNWWETGISYDQKFGDFRLGASAVASFADSEDATVEDVRAWNVGVLVGFAGFKLGAGYGSDGDSGQAVNQGNDTVKGWSVGLGYNVGAWDFGLGYYKSTAGANAGNGAGTAGKDTLEVATLGATYDLGNGLSTYIEGVWFSTDSNNDNTRDNDGVSLITGIGVEF
jgi:predicted porin